LSVSERKSGSLRVRVADDQSNVRIVGTVDFHSPPATQGTVELPVPFLPEDNGFRREVVKRLRALRLPPAPAPGEDVRVGTSAAHDDRVAACPDRDKHVRALRRLDRTRSEIRDVRRSIRGRTESLARRFDRVLGVLESWGYLDGWSLTPRGEQ